MFGVVGSYRKLCSVNLTRPIFEGDDAVGCVPGDVCVVLKLEPHDRFLCSGSDLATDITVSLGFIYNIRVSASCCVYSYRPLKAHLLDLRNSQRLFVLYNM